MTTFFANDGTLEYTVGESTAHLAPSDVRDLRRALNGYGFRTDYEKSAYREILSDAVDRVCQADTFEDMSDIIDQAFKQMHRI